MSLVGEQLGEFEILECLGKGGMGEVYKARQTSIDRFVALKTLQSSLAGDADYLLRFRQEARAAGVLNHPNLVQVISAGDCEGLHWFAMEYVEGESAQARLNRESRLAPLDAIAIVMYVATALEYGWRKAGLIHRDIKPDNIFLSGDGEVKLGDLGVAKSAGQALGLTTTGAIMGTPYYISPEQVEGRKDVDLRSDIYSLGCTLYHLLCGRPPFVGNTAAVVMMMHLSEPAPNLGGVWPECPAELAAAVEKMMQKRPADRQQNYEEVIADLRLAYDVLSGAIVGPILGQTPERATAAPQAQTDAGRRRWAGLAGALTALAVGAALLYFAPWKRGGPFPKTQREELPQAARNDSPDAIPAKEKTPATPATPAANAVAIASNRQPDAATAPTTPAPAPQPPPPSTPALSTPPPSTLAASATPKPPTEMEKWLAQVDGAQQEVFQREALKPFETGVADLRARYLAALDADIAKASGAGQLAEALVWRTERQAFEKAQNVADDDAGARAGVKVLRIAFRQRLAKLDRERIAKARALLSQYDAILAKNQTLLTQRQRLDDALLLKNKREEIAIAWVRPSPIISVAAAEAASATDYAEFAKPVFAPLASAEKPFINSLGMKFVPVPITGGPSDGQRVFFSAWKTRVEDYEVFAKATKREWPKPGFAQALSHPAVNLTWDDAQAFCEWLTERERKSAKIGQSERYRLPTDHEWSCAVGIGDRENPAETPAEKSGKISDAFPWGSAWPPPADAGNYAGEELRRAVAAHKYPIITDVIEGYRDSFMETAPVGRFPANRLGLFDLGGNALEWCEDWFDKDRKDHVLRSSAWSDHERGALLSSNRFHYPPSFRTYQYGFSGFRCVIASAPLVASPALNDASVAMATKDRPFVNSLAMKFAPVPGAKVLFCIHQTRKGDYAAYAAANPDVNGMWKKAGEIHGATVLPGLSSPLALPRGTQIVTPVSESDEHPVVCVSWEDANAFCAWLSKKEGRVYRLPTDHEWSMAVGIGAKESTGATPESLGRKLANVYPWGSSWPPPNGAGNYADTSFKAQFPNEDSIEGYSDGFPTTAPVMSFKPNPLGIYDLGGNVWEWCADWFNADQKERVLRGASWQTAGSGALLSGFRKQDSPDTRQIIHGFRCVLVATGN